MSESKINPEKVVFGAGAKTAEEVNTLINKSAQEGITQAEVDDIYKQWAKTYDQDTLLNSYSSTKPLAAARVLAEYIEDKSAPVLDLAAGTGIVGVELKELGFTNIDALDASQAMLDQATEKNVYKRLICDYMGPNTLDIKDNTYSGAVATGCFGEGHAKQDCFLEIIRVIKPGGTLVFQITNAKVSSTCLIGFDDTLNTHEDNNLWTLIKKELVSSSVGTGDYLRFVYRIK
ncbi:unnamed protein product [Owenia fusiformis]|uniref:Uncharacterized protein n=1 Tax=Owenia fusiformis TaxID=6347 RepID=A0A8J1XMH6_OWEFU|nr:unnamed protein product [Owenia fusiformis]